VDERVNSYVINYDIGKKKCQYFKTNIWSSLMTFRLARVEFDFLSILIVPLVDDI